ncbi:Octopine dehydrogenase (OcDH) [Durusdinium trenchii]|uniref:Octopine dehydrogenase (OcDH) n=1 Tax=Durusdinium trenchii TaxID=1381693 RepID=A0ABP0RJ93_9DINO
MFAARYETYAISLYADEAAKWKTHMMGSRWHDKVEGMELTLDTGRKLISTPSDISNDPSLAGKADVIILAVPSFAHGQYFEAFYPYIKAGTIVACMPARSGGDILFASKMKEKADSLAFVGFETLPWACRFTEWGKRATILGTKGQILAAVTPESEATRAIATLQGLLGVFPAIEKSPNNLGISLRNPGQVIHPGVMYGRWCSEKWDGKPLAEKPLFYQGVDDFTEKVLLGLSDEVQDVCRKVEALVPGFNLKDACTLHRWYLDSYKGQMADDSTLKLSMNTNSAYVGLTHPMNPVDGGFMPDLKYRYLAEDVPTGLCFTRGLAELLEVPTPTIDKVIMFAQVSLGKSFLVDGKMADRGAPQVLSFRELVALEMGLILRISAHEMERSRRLSAEQFLPTTPESQQPRAMRPASSDPRCSVAQRHFQGFALRPTVYASVPASARRSLPPRVAVHGLPRQASSGQFPSGALSQQSSTGSLSQSGHTPRRVLQATTSYSNLPRHSGQVRTPLAGRFQPVSAMTHSWTPRRYFPSHGAHHVKPAQPHVQQGQPPVHLLPARPKLRQPQDELVNLQSHLKRLQDLQTQLEQQLGDVQQ